MRVGGVAAMIGGLLWIGFHVWYIGAPSTEPRDVTRLIVIPGLANASFALALWSLWQTGRAGAGVRAGVLVAIAGMVVFAIGAIAVWLGAGVAWLVGILGELIITGGLALFSVANLGEKILPRWNALPLLMLALYVPSWIVDPGSVPALPRHWTEMLAVLYGVGWVLLGALLWRERDGSATGLRGRGATG